MVVLDNNSQPPSQHHHHHQPGPHHLLPPPPHSLAGGGAAPAAAELVTIEPYSAGAPIAPQQMRSMNGDGYLPGISSNGLPLAAALAMAPQPSGVPLGAAAAAKGSLTGTTMHSTLVPGTATTTTMTKNGPSRGPQQQHADYYPIPTSLIDAQLSDNSSASSHPPPSELTDPYPEYKH